MPGHTWELIGTIGAAITSSIIGPIIFEHIKRKFFKPEDVVSKEMDKNMIIVDELSAMRERFDADRVWITQFHNGGHFLHSNKSIQKFSITFEDIKPDVPSAMFIIKDVPLSIFAKSINELIKTNHIFIPDFSDQTIATYGLKQYAESTGSMAYYIIGLFDIASNKCIGTLCVDFKEPKYLTELERSCLIDKGNRLAGFLSVFLQNK